MDTRAFVIRKTIYLVITLWAIVSLLRHAEGALAHADAVQLMQTDAWRRPDEPDVQG